MKREYVLLARDYKSNKVNIGGWLASEKLDGTRAFWDSGISRGELASTVPYANTVKDTKPVVATGLWSRSGKVIHAPDFWLNSLPQTLLDGELYLGRGRFQELRSTIGQHEPDDRWDQVTYQCFDRPSPDIFSQVREIKIRNEYSFWITQCPRLAKLRCQDWPFDLVAQSLVKLLDGNYVAEAVKQERLPLAHLEAVDRLDQMLDATVQLGGEGVMLRKPSFRWDCVRSHCLLKHKPVLFGDAKIIGFTAGKGRLKGMIGALVVDYQGKRLELSGMTDAERVISSVTAAVPNSEILSTNFFHVGQVIRFKYRELSDDGIPKEARYIR